MKLWSVWFKFSIVTALFLTSCSGEDNSSDDSDKPDNPTTEQLGDLKEKQPDQSGTKDSDDKNPESKDSDSKKNVEIAGTMSIDSTGHQGESLLKPEINIVGEMVLYEGADATLDVTLSFPSDEPVSVSLNVIDETAIHGLDYLMTTRHLVFDPGDVTKKIDISLISDHLYEPGEPESFRIELENPENAVLGNTLGTVQIVDHSLDPRIYFTKGWIETKEVNDTISVEFETSEISDTDLPVTFFIHNGGAKSGEDFDGPVKRTLMIPAGQKSNTFEIKIVDDKENEFDEDFTVELINPEIDVDYPVDVAIVTIIENDDRTSTELLKTFSDLTQPEFLTSDGSVTYFSAGDGVNGRELWITDGTPEGTRMVKNINPSGDSNPGSLTLISSVLYFSADDGIHGRELWTSDGTEAGTRMVADINKSGDSSPDQMIEFESTLYFTISRPVMGEFAPTTMGELWKLVGNQAQLVRQIRTLNDRNYFIQSFPRYLTVVDTKLLLFVKTGNYKEELWESDGTTNGTVKVGGYNILEGYPLSQPKVMGPSIFFKFNQKLWKYSLGEATINEFKDRVPAFDIMNDSLFYVHNNALWKSNGADDGIPVITDLAGVQDILGSVGDKLLLSSKKYLSSPHSGFWIYDDSRNSKSIIDIPLPYFIRSQKVSENEFFIYSAGISRNQYTVALWGTNGSAEGTVLLKKLGPVNPEQTKVIRMGNDLIYNTGSDLIKLK